MLSEKISVSQSNTDLGVPLTSIKYSWFLQKATYKNKIKKVHKTQEDTAEAPKTKVWFVLRAAKHQD